MNDYNSDLRLLELLKEGVALLKKENYESAMKTFDVVLGISPGNEQAIQGRAVSLARLGHFEEAKEYLQGFRSDGTCSEVTKAICHQMSDLKSGGVELIPDKADELIKPLLNLFSFSSLFDLIKKVQKVNGFLTDKEGAALFHLAQNGGSQGVIVEIGSFCGKSTIYLASGSKSLQRERVFAVDPHTGSAEHHDDGFAAQAMPREGSTFEEFQKNINAFGLSDWVTPIVKTSEQAARNWSEPIRLLFIDGDHSFEMVEKDFLMWAPHVTNSGIIALHDCSKDFEGPRRVVEKHIFPSKHYRTLAHVGSLYVAEKIID